MCANIDTGMYTHTQSMCAWRTGALMASVSFGLLTVTVAMRCSWGSLPFCHKCESHLQPDDTWQDNLFSQGTPGRMALHSQGTPGRMICPSQGTPSRTTCPSQGTSGRMAHHTTVRRHLEKQSVPGRGYLHEQPVTAREFLPHRSQELRAGLSLFPPFTTLLPGNVP